jgi:bacteriocin biosynthesis cyclodehydratase domain-containing protein
MVPVQVTDTHSGVILWRGCTEFRAAGGDAAAAVRVILSAAAQDGSTRAEILDLFPAPDHPDVDRLIQALLDRHILYAGDPPPPPASDTEAQLETFYWHFRATPAVALANLNRRAVAVVGVNHVSRRLVTALRDSGVTNVEVVDYTLLRNRRLFDDEGERLATEWPSSLPRPRAYEGWSGGLDPQAVGCLVATCDFGGQQLFRDFNRYCVAQNVPFLPVGLDRLIGSVGPLVIPLETACYECLRARENANLEQPELARAAEDPRAVWQRQMLAAFHPSAAAVLADLAAMQLTLFLSGVTPYRVGRLIEATLMAPDLRARKVLKLPRCPVCGPLANHPSITPNRRAFVPVALSAQPGRE